MEYLEALLSLLKIFLPLTVITFSSLIITKLIKINDFLERIILIFIFNWFQIIIIIEFLSLFKKVTPLFISIMHLAFSIIILAIALFKKIEFKINLEEINKKIFFFFKYEKTNGVIKLIVVVWLIIILITTFFIGISVPPKNWDGMVAYLVRVGIWQQQHSINHYYTPVLSQLENHINPGLGLLWVLLFTNSGNILFTVQWISLLVILITLYKLLRYLKYGINLSLISVFVFSISNIVILEACTTQNDLIVASFLFIAFYFLIKVLDDKEIVLKNIIIFSLTLGVSIGSKFYAYFFIIGFIIFLLLYGKNNKLKLTKTLYMIIFTIAGFILFSSYNFIQNFITFGDFLGSKSTVDSIRIINPSIKTLIKK